MKLKNRFTFYNPDFQNLIYVAIKVDADSDDDLHINDFYVVTWITEDGAIDCNTYSEDDVNENISDGEWIVLKELNDFSDAVNGNTLFVDEPIFYRGKL